MIATSLDTAAKVLDTEPQVVYGLDDQLYHRDVALGSSMIELFRRDRQSFRTRHVDRTAHPDKPTPAMQFGTLVHLWLLEPERFTKAVADPLPEVAPDGKKWLRRKGSDHEKWWQEELDKREGRIAVDTKTLDRVHATVAAIKKHPQVPGLFKQGDPEVSIFWTDKETGLRCKCRVDWLGELAHLDLKTTVTSNPAGYARQAVKLGYHRKLAHYRAGLKAAFGETPPLIHLAVESEWPHRVALYEIDDRDNDGIELGERQRREMLVQIAECLENRDFREPWEKQVTTLQLPRWASSENEYLMEHTE